VTKHRGLSYFVLDMNAPGVERRPLFQITGEAEFNEVFLTDVRVPDTHRLGDEGSGWKVATTTLMNERVSIGGAGGGRGSGAVRHLVRVWSKRSAELSPPERAVWLDEVVRLWARAEAQRLTNGRARAQAKTGTPGPEGSVAKLVYGELNQRIFDVAVDLLGAEGGVHLPGYPMHRTDGVQAIGTRETSWEFLRSRAASIEGGTSEILRNVLGERVLGLPSDIRVDADVPWSAIGKQTS
jgi:alkylation response protein AidB-like acyl-CoA dehydrogenase